MNEQFLTDDELRQAIGDDAFKQLSGAKVGDTIDIPANAFSFSKPIQPRQKKSGLERASGVADFIGGGGRVVGEAIGTQIAQNKFESQDVGGPSDADRRRAEEIFKRRTGQSIDFSKQTQKKEISKSTFQGPSVKQIAGDVAGIGLNLATLGVGGVASKSLPKAIAGGAALGAGFGTAGALKEDTNLSTGALSGAVVGGAIPIVGRAFSAVGKQINDLPTRLVRSATGQSKKEILAGRDVSKYVLENRKIGTADKLIRDAQTTIDTINPQIQRNLRSIPITSSQGKITTKSVIDRITKDINENGGQITEAEVKSIITGLAPQAKGLLNKPSMALVTANDLRSKIDKTLGDRGFLTSQLPFNKDVLKSFTNALREEVKSKAPLGTRELFDQLKNEIRLRDILEDKIAKGSRNQIISFGDLIGGGVGGLALGGFPGTAAGIAGRRLMQSTTALTGGAVAINEINRAIAPILKKLTPAEQVVVLNLIRTGQGLNSQ